MEKNQSISFVIWDKDKLKQLTEEEKLVWFDMYHDESLEEKTFDRLLIQEHKKDVLEVSRSAFFVAYYLLMKEERILSLCRVVQKGFGLYLEGLKTHRDYYNLGYASYLLKEVLLDLKNRDFTDLRIFVEKNQRLCLSFIEKQGFKRYDETDEVFRYKKSIMKRPRYYLFLVGKGFGTSLIYGINYHKDNNLRFYKMAQHYVRLDYVFALVILNIVFFLPSINVSLPLFLLIHLGILALSQVANGLRLLNLRKESNENIKLFRYNVRKHFFFVLVVTILFIIITRLINLMI